MVHEQKVLEGVGKKAPSAQEVQDALRSLDSVSAVTEMPTDDNAHRFQFMAPQGLDLRAPIYQLMVQKGWLLLELRRDAQTLEDVFKVLTRGDERRDRGRAPVEDDEDEDEDEDDASEATAGAASDEDEDEDDESDEDEEDVDEESEEDDEKPAKKG